MACSDLWKKQTQTWENKSRLLLIFFALFFGLVDGSLHVYSCVCCHSLKRHFWHSHTFICEDASETIDCDIQFYFHRLESYPCNMVHAFKLYINHPLMNLSKLSRNMLTHSIPKHLQAPLSSSIVSHFPIQTTHLAHHEDSHKGRRAGALQVSRRCCSHMRPLLTRLSALPSMEVPLVVCSVQQLVLSVS